ncbi:MAG: MTH938/NDUFAF3 family protein, partial [Burkholderiales bacterium]
MKLHLAGATAQNLFTGYGAGYVAVNTVEHRRSLVVLPDQLILDWSGQTFESLTAADFAPLAALGREILLLGTGAKIRFPRPEILRPLIEARVGVEIMDLQAA